MSTHGRVCFYIPYLYPVASGGKIKTVGGSEVRHWALARALAQRNFEVVIATCDYGQGEAVNREGVTLLRTFATDAGLPGFRFFYPRLWKAARTLKRANADVYLASGSGIGTGWAYDAARFCRARFVFLASSDGDALPSLPWLSRRRDKWWYLRALRGADVRVAQTESQAQLFREHFGVDAVVIPNPVEVPAAEADVAANDAVLWLSTYKSSKRPEWFIELARRLPRLRFVMVGFSPAGEAGDTWLRVQAAAADLQNLEVHGFVEHSRISEFLRAAAVFVHTSPLEGFPMTLLEAWSYGIPTVTSFDPGGVVKRHGIGEVVHEFEELVRQVDTTMARPETRRAIGARARAYVENHHGADQTYEPLATVLDDLIRSRRQLSK